MEGHNLPTKEMEIDPYGPIFLSTNFTFMLKKNCQSE